MESFNQFSAARRFPASLAPSHLRLVPELRHSPNRRSTAPHPATHSVQKLVRLCGRSLRFDICTFMSDVRGLDGMAYAPHFEAPELALLTDAARLPMEKDGYVGLSNLGLHPAYKNAPWVQGPIQANAFFGHAIRGAHGETVGTLAGYNLKPRVLDIEEMADFRHFAHVLEEQLKLTSLALQDPLTDLMNRRGFHDLLETEWKRAQRALSPIQLAIIDIDRFKAINDTLGHDCGDEILIQVADLVNQTERRAGDAAARLGGEEFAVILPGCDEKAASNILNRLRENVAKMDMSCHGDHLQRVSISIGYAGVQHGESCDEAFKAPVSHYLKAADEALYNAKQAGRNRVELMHVA